MALDCPKCRTPTLVSLPALGGARLQRCERCSGTWLDYGELSDAVAAGVALTDAALPTPAEDAQGGDCPRCRIPLSRTDVPGESFAVDRCRRCGGTFLDRGELAALATSRWAEDLESLFRPRAVAAPGHRAAVRPDAPSGLGIDDRKVLARAAELAERHPEAAAFLEQALRRRAP